jgi:hypothetical protein
MYDVYISSSWSNKNKVRSLANRIRKECKLSVFDFTDENCRKSQLIPHGVIESFVNSNITSYKQYLNSYEPYKLAVNENKRIISECQVILLLMPCGLDATADWAYGVGCGKPSLVIGHPKKGDFAPTHLWADDIVEDTTETINWLLLNII